MAGEVVRVPGGLNLMGEFNGARHAEVGGAACDGGCGAQDYLMSIAFKCMQLGGCSMCGKCAKFRPPVRNTIPNH
jgi:hypothetical protein